MLAGIDSCLRASQYTNAEATKRDVAQTMENYSNLSWKSSRYVFNDGRVKDLISLQGTIPVAYKGCTYNIPICIWLMDTHPNNAPICYVKPTPDMQIKVSMYVDHNGKIYLPYLHDWNPSSSDLLGVIQVMTIAFGEQPPVFSKQRIDSNPQPQSPYPTSVQHRYMPMPGTSSVTPYAVTSVGHQPPQATPYPPAPYPAAYPMYPPQPQQPTVPQNNSGTIGEEHIKASLLSAVQDKLKKKFAEMACQCKAEMDILQQTRQELTTGKGKIQELIDKLKKEAVDLDRNISILKDREAELQKAIDELNEQGDIDVDEAVTTTTPLYKQILNAYAEESATEDTIYYMGEALRRGVIDLDVFLKQVRTLSRKQFMLRALMQKCRQKAGLAC